MSAAAGIGHQILSVSPQGPYFADAGQAVTAARYANDHYAGLVLRYLFWHPRTTFNSP